MIGSIILVMRSRSSGGAKRAHRGHEPCLLCTCSQSEGVAGVSDIDNMHHAAAAPLHCAHLKADPKLDFRRPVFYFGFPRFLVFHS
jgi:hypothetical protein